MQDVAMKLETFLKERHISDPEFGAMIGRDRTTVLRLRTKVTLPDWETLSAIVKATDGAVTPADFLDTYVERRGAA
jgi:hypothetical protein